MIYGLNNKISIFLLVSLITTIFYSLLVSYSYSLSSSFIRQDLRDDSNDMILHPTFNVNKKNITNQKIATNLTSCTILDSLTNSSITPYGDITEVSYLSDGKFFNTTLWVSDFINFTKPLFAEGIDILQLPNDENMTLYELANEYVKFKVGSFDIINPIFLTKNPKNITLDKEQGFNFEVMTTRNDSSRTEEIYSWTIVEHNNKIYDFVFSSLSHRYDDLLDDVKKVMNSFKFIDNSIHSNLENDSSFHINNKLNVAFIVPPNSDIDDYGHLIRINFPPPDYKLISKSYQILMDVKSTFDNGIDYIKKIWFDNSTQKWKETFYETKILKEIQENNKYENDGNLRIIEENEFTNFQQSY